MAVEQQHNETGAAVSLVRRLLQSGRLSNDERRLIESTSLVVRNFEADQEVLLQSSITSAIRNDKFL